MNNPISEMVVIIRPSFIKICDEDACKAATLNHILYWIAQKAKEGTEFWYSTGEDIWKGMSYAWGITTIRKAVKELVDSKFIGQRRNPTKGYDQTRHYFFGKEQALALLEACQKATVCIWHIGLPDKVIDLIKSHLTDLSNGIDRFVKCNCQNYQMELTDLLNAIDKSVKAIPKVSTKITTKDSDKERDSIAAKYEQGYEGDFTIVQSPPALALSENLSSPQGDEHGTPAHATVSSSIQPDTADVRSLLRNPIVAHGTETPARQETKDRGKNKRADKPKSVTPSAITLTLQENIFWSLWGDVWFNKDIPPTLNQTAYQHVQKLAPHITSSEDLGSLIEFARKDLGDHAGVKRKSIYLGNLVNCYSRWKQTRASPPPADDPYAEFRSKTLDVDQNKRNIEKMYARVAAKKAAEAAAKGATNAIC